MKQTEITKEEIEAVKTLLKGIGQNTDREGLLDTPRRYVKFLKEFYRATNPNPKKIWVFYWIRFFKQNKFGIFAAIKNKWG